MVKIQPSTGSFLFILVTFFMQILIYSNPIKSTGIQWDEETIAEHDKLRGTRMKVHFLKIVKIF